MPDAKDDGKSDTVPRPVSLFGPAWFRSDTDDPRAEAPISAVFGTRLTVPPGAAFAAPGVVALVPLALSAPSVTTLMSTVDFVSGT